LYKNKNTQKYKPSLRKELNI